MERRIAGLLAHVQVMEAMVVMKNTYKHAALPLEHTTWNARVQLGCRDGAVDISR